MVGLTVAAVALAACGLILRAAGVDVRAGQPPEPGWTAYPILTIVHSPRRIRRIGVGTLVTWADGTRTLYIHR